MKYVILEKGHVMSHTRMRRGKLEHVSSHERKGREREAHGDFDLKYSSESNPVVIKTYEDIDRHVPTDMTNKQRQATKSAVRRALEYVRILPSMFGVREDMEIKRLEFTKHKDSPLVFVRIEAGGKNDEGTAAALFARDNFHMMINVGGGIKSITGGNWKPGFHIDLKKSGGREMDKRLYVVTLDEEFEKARVKPHVRTRRGKLERVKGFERKHSTNFHFLKPTEGGPDIRRSDLQSANGVFERRGLRAKVGFEYSPYIGHRAIVLNAATRKDLLAAKHILKTDYSIELG